MFDFVAFFMVTKNDFCLKESCEALIEQGVRRFFFCVPKEHWDGTPVSLEARRSLDTRDVHLDDRPGISSKIFFLNITATEGLRYIEKETWVRNWVLKTLHRDHVLIVDGDELWRKGAVEALDQFIRENDNPATVTMNALSVAGCPGYPVVSSQEGLLVYAKASKTRFSHGRTTREYPLHMAYDGLIHFSATRRTREELIQALRRSSHYDDPDYNFEGWIENKLNLKPGEKDCHMYVPYQVWQEARHFTSEEWEEIPESLKVYLGRPE